MTDQIDGSRRWRQRWRRCGPGARPPRTSCSAICRPAAGRSRPSPRPTRSPPQIAIDEINAAGGVAGKKLRIVSFDTAGKPDQAVVGLRKLAEDDKVLAIIGPFSSSECRVVFPAGDRAGVAAMSMASSAPNLAEPFKFAFRNTSDEGYMFERVMRALKDKNFPIATGAVAYATDDVISKVMGEIVLPGIMKKSGTDVKLSVTFQTQAFDFSAQVSQLLGQPTDLIGVGSGPEPATRLVQELRRQGHKGRLVAGSTIADPELGRQMGKAGDGTTIPTTFYADLNDRTKAFQAEFAKRAKAAGLDRTTAAQFDAATYDIVLFYAHAMKQAKVTGDRRQACGRAHRDQGRTAQDEELPGARRRDLVRLERRRAEAGLRHPVAGRQVDAARPVRSGVVKRGM